MIERFTLDDLPVFIFPTVLHLSDILFTVLGGFTEILWIVLLASVIQSALLLSAWASNRQSVQIFRSAQSTAKAKSVQ
jgi:hypothetical protein